MPLKKRLSKPFLLIPCLVLLLGGCGKSEPQYYEVQDLKPAGDTPAHDHDHDHAAHAHQASSGPGFSYTVPEGWRELPASTMKVLSFEAGRPMELPAELSVSVFPGDVGGQVANINRWRRQVGLGPLDPAVAEDFIEELTISGMPGWEVDFTGPAGSGADGGTARVRVAVVFREGQSWFFKLMGNVAAVEGELANYRAFLQTVQF